MNKRSISGTRNIQIPVYHLIDDIKIIPLGGIDQELTGIKYGELNTPDSAGAGSEEWRGIIRHEIHVLTPGH